MGDLCAGGDAHRRRAATLLHPAQRRAGAHAAVAARPHALNSAADQAPVAVRLAAGDARVALALPRDVHGLRILAALAPRGIGEAAQRPHPAARAGLRIVPIGGAHVRARAAPAGWPPPARGGVGPGPPTAARNTPPQTGRARPPKPAPLA